MEKGLVERLTPELRGRGRLYGLTPLGQSFAVALEFEGRRPPMTPMVRGSHPRAWFAALSQKFGAERARRPFIDAGMVSAVELPLRQWIPLRSQLNLLEAVERRFGDGSYRLIRELAADAIGHYPSARRYLSRALPLRMVIELAPAAYLRELNHGRMEVEVSNGSADFRHYDWLSSPARCATWHGTYEGSFRFRRVDATVVKEGCLLRGDEFCGYLAQWSE